MGRPQGGGGDRVLPAAQPGLERSDGLLEGAGHLLPVRQPEQLDLLQDLVREPEQGSPVDLRRGGDLEQRSHRGSESRWASGPV